MTDKILYPTPVALTGTNVYVVINSGKVPVTVKVGSDFVVIPKDSSKEFQSLPVSSNPNVKIVKKLAVPKVAASSKVASASSNIGDK